jgi:hypothetical protein
MPIGEAWNIDDPKKPWIDWDPQANIRIPIGVADWLTELGDTYLSHEVITAAPLECADEGTFASGTIPVRMRLVSSPTYVAGEKYPFTVRVHGADGLTQDDRTFWLKVKDR